MQFGVNSPPALVPLTNRLSFKSPGCMANLRQRFLDRKLPPADLVVSSSRGAHAAFLLFKAPSLVLHGRVLVGLNLVSGGTCT